MIPLRSNLPFIPCPRRLPALPAYPYSSDSESEYLRPAPSFAGRRAVLPSSPLTIRTRPHRGSSPRRRLHDPTIRCDRNLGWSIDYATASLVDHLDKESRRAADVLREVRSHGRHIEVSGCRMREIVYLNFDKLDDALFAGNLRNAVFLDVKDIGLETSGATFNPGAGFNPRVSRVSIVLNREIHKAASADEIVANLIHHMIHAYFLVACGPQGKDEVGYGRLGHGMHFSKILYTIKKISRFGNVRPLPLSFMQHPKLRFHSSHALYRMRQSHERYDCSYCGPEVKSIPAADVNEWYRANCEPLLKLPEFMHKSTVHVFEKGELKEIPRAVAAPSNETVEFMFDEEAIQIPAEKLADYPGVKEAFDKKPWMEVPKDTEMETFLALLEFLHTGSFSPDPNKYRDLKGQGPPVIRPVHPESPPVLLTSIRLHRLASALDFKEPAELALKRLHEQAITREDPITILREIYNTPDPDKDLRRWAIEFLIRRPDDVYQPRLDGRFPGVPNLRKLEFGPMLRERWHDLLYSNAAVRGDRDTAYDLITGKRALGLVSYARPPSPWMHIRRPTLTLDDLDVRSYGVHPYHVPSRSRASSDPYRDASYSGYGYSDADPNFLWGDLDDRFEDLGLY